MTDNEIKKALECCTTNGASCKDCPAFVKVDRSNCKKYFRGALDLINRLEAEVERLRGDLDVVNHTISYFKAEAVKEFADRLKAICYYRDGDGKYLVFEDELDVLVKETVGE